MAFRVISILEDFFADVQPRTFRMWLSSWFPCPLCKRWALKYVRAHGGVVCTSDECEERAKKWARMMVERSRAPN